MLKLFILPDRYQGRLYFILREILTGCRRHNFVSLNASIAFFALFAFIPFVLLVFFFLSQWLSSSAFALEELSNITSRDESKNYG
jgi:membrane protein